MATIDLEHLPERTSPEYMPTLIDNVVSAFGVFLADTMALDYCGVTGKERTLVLGNSEYKRRTKVLRATKFLEEIDEIETLSKELSSTVLDDQYDFRDKKQKKEYDKDFKDLFGMRLKAAEMRRDLLNMSKREDAQEEVDSLNIFFVPLSKKEFDEMRNVEIQEGTDITTDVFKDEETTQSAGTAAHKETLAAQTDEHAMGGYLVNQDGSVEDFQ